jgi:hypothetical protein
MCYVAPDKIEIASSSNGRTNKSRRVVNQRMPIFQFSNIFQRIRPVTVKTLAYRVAMGAFDYAFLQVITLRFFVWLLD